MKRRDFLPRSAALATVPLAGTGSPLLARRLTQSGVRFVEVSHNLNFINGTGWDTHFEGHFNQHVLIQELDIALAA